MVTTPKLIIGNVTVKGGDDYGDHTWPKTLGLEAPKVAWDLPISDATAILAGPQEVTITMVASDGTTKKIERVIVVKEEHSPDALIRRVIFSDVRYYPPFAWVRATYNQTAESGTFRQVAADSQAQAAPPPLIQNWTLAPYSLKNEQTPWNAQDIAIDVLTQTVTGHDWKDIVVRNLSRPRTTFIPNNIYVDARGSDAIGQTLGALGGLDIRVADDGAIEIVDAYLGAEKTVIDAIVQSYSLERRGLLRWISMANVAPKAGKVRFTRRVEIRLDSWEAAPGSDGNASTQGDDVTWGTDNTPTMINVIPVTDQRIPYPSSSDQTIQGALLPLSRYCQALDTLADYPSGTPAGAKPISRQQLLAGPGGAGNISSSPLLSEVLELLYVTPPGSEATGADLNWANRCAALKNFVRTLYKVNPVVARQAVPGSWKAERVGLLDAATGTRQPATVYADYVQRPTGPGFTSTDKFGWLVNSVPPNSPNTQSFPAGTKTYSDPGPYNQNPFLLSGASAAPFQVQCIDPTNAVFYFSQSAQDTTKIKHGAEIHAGLVWGSPTSATGDLYRGDAISLWSQARKLLTHRVALVVSAIPGGPNGPNGLHTYNVSVERALALLGAPANSVTPRAPTRELRVQTGTALARIPWDDSLRGPILGCFSAQGTSDPSKLIPVNNPDLQAFSEAVFANYMATMLDHYEGTMTIGFTPGVEPLGALQQVQHTFTAEGKIYTTLRCAGVVAPPNPESLISQASRNVLFRGIT